MTTARAGRRRRLLHEGTNEVSSASKNKDSESSSASGARYAPGANSLSFSLARRLFPQSPMSVLLAVLGTLGVVSLAILGAYLGDRSIENPMGPFTQLFAFSGPGTFGAWVASTLWLAVAFVSYVIYGLRRHQMDDLKSQYRWWILAALSAVIMSFITSVGFHHIVANQLAITTGWTALSDNAVWWLIPSVVLCGGLVIRMAVEQSESKASLALTILAVLVTSAGWTADAGLVPESFQASYPWLGFAWLGTALSTFGTAFLLLSILMFARSIVREADGLVVRSERVKSTQSSSSKAKLTAKADKTNDSTKSRSKNSQSSSQDATTLSVTQPDSQPTEQYYQSKAERRAEAKRKRKEAMAQNQADSGSDWVSGSESDYQDEYDDANQPRKLTKSQRKRLRKQKARRAA